MVVGDCLSAVNLGAGSFWFFSLVLQHADFVIFTLEETVFVPVTFDPGLWKDTLSKLERLYVEARPPSVWMAPSGSAPSGEYSRLPNTRVVPAEMITNFKKALFKRRW